MKLTMLLILIVIHELPIIMMNMVKDKVIFIRMTMMTITKEFELTMQRFILKFHVNMMMVQTKMMTIATDGAYFE